MISETETLTARSLPSVSEADIWQSSPSDRVHCTESNDNPSAWDSSTCTSNDPLNAEEISPSSLLTSQLSSSVPADAGVKWAETSRLEPGLMNTSSPMDRLLPDRSVSTNLT